MSRSRSLRSMIIGLALLLPTTQAGCGRTGWEVFGAFAEVALYVAVEAALHAHDHHLHHSHCGHRYIYYQDRAVYEYEGRWEYYDYDNDTWYYYPDGMPAE